MIPKVDLARDILEKTGFGSKRSLFRIEIGFSNDVFSVGEELVLKIGKSAEDRLALEKEVFLCQLFAGRICSPEVVHADTSLNEFDLPYIIYRKIRGDNLYTVWHLYSVEQRRKRDLRHSASYQRNRSHRFRSKVSCQHCRHLRCTLELARPYLFTHRTSTGAS